MCNLSKENFLKTSLFFLWSKQQCISVSNTEKKMSKKIIYLTELFKKFPHLKFLRFRNWDCCIYQNFMQTKNVQYNYFV